jgi:hypothetical protein
MEEYGDVDNKEKCVELLRKIPEPKEIPWQLTMRSMLSAHIFTAWGPPSASQHFPRKNAAKFLKWNR